MKSRSLITNSKIRERVNAVSTAELDSLIRETISERNSLNQARIKKNESPLVSHQEMEALLPDISHYIESFLGIPLTHEATLFNQQNFLSSLFTIYKNNPVYPLISTMMTTNYALLSYSLFNDYGPLHGTLVAVAGIDMALMTPFLNHWGRFKATPASGMYEWNARGMSVQPNRNRSKTICTLIHEGFHHFQRLADYALGDNRFMIFIEGHATAGTVSGARLYAEGTGDEGPLYAALSYRKHYLITTIAHRLRMPTRFGRLTDMTRWTANAKYTIGTSFFALLEKEYGPSIYGEILKNPEILKGTPQPQS